MKSDKITKDESRMEDGMHNQDDLPALGEFVSSAPLGKIEDASRKSRQGVKTAFHYLETLMNQSFDSDKFYINVREAQAALNEALRHREEHDRLNNTRRSETGHYR